MGKTISTIEYIAPKKLWGAAICEVIEYEDGTMWVSNGEYSTQVNYCPFTGKKATVQMVKAENNTNKFIIYKNE